MATYTVTAPDGNDYSVEGPDGASDEEVRAEVLRQNPGAGTAKRFGPGAAGMKDVLADGSTALSDSPEAAAARSPLAGTGRLEKAMLGYGKSFVDTGRGLQQLAAPVMDAIDPRSQTMSGLITGKQPVSRADELRQRVDDQRQIDKDLMSDGWGVAGDIAGNLAQWAIPGSVVAKGASKIPALTRIAAASPKLYATAAAALPGAVQGLTAPLGSGDSRLQSVGVNAGLSTLGEAGNVAVQRLLKVGKDAVPAAARNAYNTAQKYGIDLSFPQLTNSSFVKHLSNLADSMPLSGAAERFANQRAQFNNALGRLAGFRANGAINTNLTDTAQSVIGQRIGDIAKRNTAIVTPANIRKITNTLNEVHRSGLDDATKKTVLERANALMKTAQSTPTGVKIDGKVWREQNTALQRQIQSATGDLKYHLGNLQKAYMDMMDVGMSPRDKPFWTAARTAYRNLKTIQPLAEKAGNEGVSPTLLRGAAINTKNNRGRMAELANLGKEQLTERVPNSGTAQKNAIHALTGSLAAGLGFGLGKASGHDTTDSAMEGLAGAAGLGLLGRGLNSKYAARYYMARAPRFAQDTIPEIGNLLKYAVPVSDNQ